MNNIKKPIQKDSAFETEVIERFDCIQKSQATLRQDLREIIREEIKNVLESRNKKAWWQMA